VEKMEEMTSSYIRRIKAHRKVQMKILQKEFQKYSALFKMGVISGKQFVEYLGLDKITNE